MNFDKIISNKEASADYMIDGITKVCGECGKRDAGSEGEAAAAEYMANELKKLGCEKVSVEPFKLNPNAFMGWIYITVTLILAGFVCLFFVPILAVILVVLGFVFMIGEFIMYKPVVDKLFPQKTSHNVFATKAPKGEIKRRVYFNGHMDAACEWSFNYLFGGKGFIGHFLISIVGTLYLLAVAIAVMIVGKGVFFGQSIAGLGGVYTAAWVAIAFVPFWIALYWLWRENAVVDGANDDLTGCFMSIALIKALKDNGIELENTEIGVVLTGAEEAGLRGSKAWCEAHAKDCDKNTLILSFDTIHDADCHYVNMADMNGTVKTDAELSELYLKASSNMKVPCEKGSVPFGATDCAAFSQAGVRAAGVTCMSHDLPNYYHTRRDVPALLDKDCLANTFAVAAETLRMLDEGALDGEAE